MVPLFVIASSFVKTTGEVGETIPPDARTSTCHSASCSHNAAVEVSFLDTDTPFDVLLMVAIPAVFDVAVTFSVTESPALKLIPEKS